MASEGDYAIVDATPDRDSNGKVLVILDDESTAQEMATELRRRGCRVDVRAVRPRRTA